MIVSTREPHWQVCMVSSSFGELLNTSELFLGRVAAMAVQLVVDFAIDDASVDLVLLPSSVDLPPSKVTNDRKVCGFHLT